MSARSEKAGRGERHVARRTEGPAVSPGRRGGRDPRGPASLPARWPLLVVLASTLGLALGVVMIALNLISASMPVSTASIGRNPDSQGWERRTLGNPDAKVVITEWSDFQCPACRAYALTREPVLEQQYLSTGKVRFVYRNFAFLGPESIFAAEAAEAAADQGRYFDYRALLWQRQRGENLGAFKAENLKAFAAELGLDQKKFNEALDSGKYRSAVLAEQKEGEALGVNATPTLMINGQIVPGVPSVEKMKALIDEELAKNS